MSIQLGDKVRDSVTGVEGVAISFIRCVTGCDQFLVQQGKITAEGKLSDGLWFDRHRLTIVESGAVKIPGCPPVPDAFDGRAQGGPMTTY